ncbi:hypothetical protein [Flagellimonas onchidii]|uniref:hypothetical protein n=1 Tax=Flagellimonas onchidii TaxID=2562684 RepID=UPI0010A5BA10|nr:hypothetical protein [Allomuricauda onchidii]
MKVLYKRIVGRLSSKEAKTAYQEASVPACKFVDLYRGQYLNWEAFDTFPLPAVLFEYRINLKDKTVTITLHVCYEQPQDTSSISKTMDNALKYFDFIEVTNGLIDELESEVNGKLELIDEEMVKDDAIVNVHLLTYTGQYIGRNKEKFKYTTGEDIDMDPGIKHQFD